MLQEAFSSLGSLFGFGLQAEHRAAAGLSDPGYRHQQAEWVLTDLQRSPGQPGPGPATCFTQTLYTAGSKRSTAVQTSTHINAIKDSHCKVNQITFSSKYSRCRCAECVTAVFALRLLWSAQTCVTRVGFGSWADSGARECVRSFTGRVSSVSVENKPNHIRGSSSDI